MAIGEEIVLFPANKLCLLRRAKTAGFRSILELRTFPQIGDDPKQNFYGDWLIN
jgi:hypothetical protein